jgi:predicted ester cyclase
MSEQETNIAAIKRAIEALNRRDFGVIGELAQPDPQGHDLNGSPDGGLRYISEAGRDVDPLQGLLQAVPDVQVEVRQIFACGDRVAAHLVMTGTHQGELFGIPGTGKRVEINDFHFYRLVDGKIAETWQVDDIWGLMRQIGAAK